MVNPNLPLDGTTTPPAQGFKRLHVPFAHSRLTGTQAVLDIALENDSVALREPEGLVCGLQGIAVGGEAGEDGGIGGAAVVVDDLEAGAGVLGHGHTGSSKDAIGSYMTEKPINKIAP